MICEYDGKKITGEPYKVMMRKQGELASANSAMPEDESTDLPAVGYRYFHDVTCYELFIADEEEYEALDIPGSEIG